MCLNPPNIYSDNRQDYKSLELISRQSEVPARQKKTAPKRGAGWTGVFEE